MSYSEPSAQVGLRNGYILLRPYIPVNQIAGAASDADLLPIETPHPSPYPLVIFAISHCSSLDK
jgi:hypothetical protein